MLGQSLGLVRRRKCKMHRVARPKNPKKSPSLVPLWAELGRIVRRL